MTDTTPAALAALTQPIRDALLLGSSSGTWVPGSARLQFSKLLDALDALAQERDALLAAQPSAEPVAPKQWPFVETPGQFTDRLREAAIELGDLLAAVRFVLIERPPTFAAQQVQPAAPAAPQAAPSDELLQMGYFISHPNIAQGDPFFSKYPADAVGWTMVHAYAGTAPQAAQPQPGMVQVLKEDANAYCAILSLLGMEEEGDPVAAVRRLIAEADTLQEAAFKAAQPQPLAPSRILDLWENYVGDPSVIGYPLTDTDKVNFARAVEYVHGIGAAAQAPKEPQP